MIDIHIKSIPISEMRIPGSLGDYWYEGDKLEVRVAEYGDVDFETLIALHEMIEEWLTKQRGLTEPQIQAFDEMWFNERPRGDDEEPGFDPRAPYVKEHTFADAIERLALVQAGRTMHEYEEATARL